MEDCWRAEEGRDREDLEVVFVWEEGRDVVDILFVDAGWWEGG